MKWKTEVLTSCSQVKLGHGPPPVIFSHKPLQFTTPMSFSSHLAVAHLERLIFTRGKVFILKVDLGLFKFSS